MSELLSIVAILFVLAKLYSTELSHAATWLRSRLAPALDAGGKLWSAPGWAMLMLGMLMGVVLVGVVPRLVRVDWPSINLPSIPSVSKVDRVTYVYEKDSGGVPSGVMVALNKLNRQGVLATKFEDDTTNANQQVPTQYRIAHSEATKFGLPALVVQSGTSVVRVANVNTEAETLEAAR